jgi:hypothetical protein
MAKPPKHEVNKVRLVDALVACRAELQRQTSPLYGKGGIAVLANEIIRLHEDLVFLATGDREYFKNRQPWGTTGPSVPNGPLSGPQSPKDEPG